MRRAGFATSLGLGLGNMQGFSPASLFAAGQAGFWFDPADLASMWQDSAGTTPAAVDSPVGRILDKSGNGNHLIQATSGKRPILRFGGGLHWLEFDGVDDFMATASAVDLSAASSLGYAVAFTPTSTVVGEVSEFGPNTNTTALSFYVAAINDSIPGAFSVGINSNAIDGVRSTSTSFGNGATSLVSAQGLDITEAAAAAKMPIRRNGAAVALTVLADGGAAGTGYSSQTLYVGSRAGASVFAAMKLHGYILRATPFTTAEIAHVEIWLGTKAGLAI